MKKPTLAGLGFELHPAKTIFANQKFYRAVFWSLGASVVVGAYIAQPLMEFVQPILLGTLGSIVLFTFFFSYLATAVIRRSRLLIVLTYCGWLLTSVVWGWTYLEAMQNASSNQHECAVLQAELINKAASRDGVAAAFTAMRCRPNYGPPPEAWNGPRIP